RLRFSAPAAFSGASRIALRDVATGQSWPAQRIDPDNGDPLVDSVEFSGPFPPKAMLRAELPDGFADDSGRSLDRTITSRLEVRPAGVPPLAKFAARFGLVEAASPVLPVTIRNLEANPSTREKLAVEARLAARQESVAGPDAATILRWLDALETADRETSIFGSGDASKSLALPRTLGSDAFEVVGVPLAGNGLHIVEVESQVLGASLLGKAKPMYVAAGALVTNLGVHFEWGDESSLVWVTTLDRAEPVPGARVTVANCRGETLADA